MHSESNIRQQNNKLTSGLPGWPGQKNCREDGKSSRQLGSKYWRPDFFLQSSTTGSKIIVRYRVATAISLIKITEGIVCRFILRNE